MRDRTRPDERIRRRSILTAGAITIAGVAATISMGEHDRIVADETRRKVLEAENASLTQHEALRRAHHTLRYMAAYTVLDGPNHVLSYGYAFSERERSKAIMDIARVIHADDMLRADPEAAFMYAVTAIKEVGSAQHPELYRDKGPSYTIDYLTAIGLAIGPETVPTPPGSPLAYKVLHTTRLYWGSVATDVLSAPRLAAVDRWNLAAAGVQLDRHMAAILPRSKPRATRRRQRRSRIWPLSLRKPSHSK